MPTWSPNWTDVRFDHDAVAAAADACERAACVVRDTSHQGGAMAAGAQADGSGPWRQEFDRALAAVGARSDEVESRLRAAAHQLREASQVAHTEQAARLESRQRWALEAAAEGQTVQMPSPR